MSIDLSERATNKLSALIGTSNPAAIAKLIERFADNEPYVQALMLEEPSEEQLKESVAMFERGEQEINETGGHDFEQALRNVANKFELDLDQ